MGYKEYSEIIKDKLNLKTSPVGVKLFKNIEDAEKILDKGGKLPHCQAILNASKGESFYGTSDEIGCPIGSSILGLNEIKEDLIKGERFNKMNVTSNKESGEKLFSQVSKINEKIEAIGYSPLEDVKFTPDVIVILAIPKQIFNLIRANSYTYGESLKTSIGGTQSLCGDIVANSYLRGNTNLSFGCIGSHLATDIKETELVFGFPNEKLEEITNALNEIKIIL